MEKDRMAALMIVVTAILQMVNAGYDPDFQRIRGYINSQNFAVAEQELNKIGTRNAEWYFSWELS